MTEIKNIIGVLESVKRRELTHNSKTNALCNTPSESIGVKAIDAAIHILSILQDPRECQLHQVDVEMNLWSCTECPAEWNIDDGNPFENNMWFCPECGRKINAITFREIDEDGDLVDRVLTREEWKLKKRGYMNG